MSLALGIGLVQVESKLCWIFIPKNASSSMNNFLKNSGFQEAALKTLPYDFTYFVIWREPLCRWFSGAAQYYTSNNYIGPEFAFDQLCLDMHTQTQFSFIKGLDKEIKFFKMNEKEKNIEIKIQQWLSSKNVDFEEKKIVDNKTTPQKQYIIKSLKSYYLDNNLQEKMLNYLAPDYEIWKKLNKPFFL